MKKLLILLTILSAAPVLANPDPFSVYTDATPQGCISAPDHRDTYTLPELIQIGICNNPALNRSFMAIRSAQADKGDALSSYLPTLTATGSISQTHTHIESTESGNTYPYAGNIALSWLIYDFGGRSATTAQMQAYLDSAQFNYNAKLHDMVLAINQAYFDLLSAQEVLKSTESSAASFKKSYEESVKRFELGLVSASDKLLAKTSYDQSLLDVVTAKNTLKKAQGALSVLLNLNPDVALTVTTPPKDRDLTALATDETVSDMMETALSLRPELKAKQSDLTASERAIEIARAAGLPSLSASAKAGWDDSWKRHNNGQFGTSSGLSLSFPLFTGFSDTYRVARARFDYRQAALAVAETQDSVRADVWNSYQDYTTAVEAHTLSTNMLESAVENERVAFRSYQVGKGSILELLTAGSQLATARQQVIVAFYDVLTSKAALYRAIGRF